MKNTHNISPQNYNCIHHWLRNNFIKDSVCSNKTCSGISKRIEWALVKGKEYEKKRENFICLCKSCHSKYDLTESSKIKIGLARKGVKYTKEQLSSRYIPILQYDYEGKKLIKRFSSTAEASKELGINRGGLASALRGYYKHAGRFTWRYESRHKNTTRKLIESAANLVEGKE